MDPLVVAVAVAGGLLLGVLWVVGLRRDVDRRSGRGAEFDTDEVTGSMWTSSARCPECHAAGAILRRDADGLLHTCMRCGHQHRRDSRA